MQTLRKVLSVGALVALVVGVAVFATRDTNQAPVEVHYLFGQAEAPLWQLVGGAFLGGGVAGWLFSVLPWTRARLNARRQRKRAERLETELHQLRNLPLSQDESAAAPNLAEGSAGDSGSG